ncbi:hypothetical protein CPB84DRAFT_1764727 [Gymnopilus junonius]|uniref:Thioredoxin domain-containing protein n=1 Tax=Gymnopilus junonius TaxID=109634 RepID=A0A9P5NVL6_GYMJU|nr:hypothetical protein CPB84DRAFT_1764727 [Gymnopilus junonius]
MPIIFADGSIDPITLFKVPEHFVVFYSSIVNGEMWCPDCRRVEDIVKETFSGDDHDVLIVYVGDRTQWKNPTNIYRQEPWHITNVPTIIRLKNGKEDGRLSDDQEILNELKTFVKSE